MPEDMEKQRQEQAGQTSGRARDNAQVDSCGLIAKPAAATLAEGLVGEQQQDLPALLEFLQSFWASYAAESPQDRVVPADRSRLLDDLLAEPFPDNPSPLAKILAQTRELLERETVRTGHPMFLGYVTPPSLDIAALGDALASIVNQNVAFAALSPLGTTLEATVVRWLGDIVGYPPTCGGILTSGGSNANLYGIAVARYRLLGATSATDGNYADARRLRVYCSDHTHHSVDKAAILLGLGTRSVTRIPTDNEHRIQIPALRAAIARDCASGDWLPAVIVGNAGTRLCCAYDDLRALRNVADEHNIWLHVDAAYGGFLRLADSPPPGAESVHLGDSVVLDPHKLLFVPFDCGSVLVRHPRELSNCFGMEGEYIEMKTSSGLDDFANLGMQLGRSMKALKVWLALKRFGRTGFAAEYTRLLSLARHMARRITEDKRFELLGPTAGTAVCFRWRGERPMRDAQLSLLNTNIRRTVIRQGHAFIDEVDVAGQAGFRLCMTNFRTEASHLDALLQVIATVATTVRKAGE